MKTAMRRRYLSCALVWAALICSDLAVAAPPNDLSAAQDAARHSELSQDRLWKLLLHMDDGLFGASSRADGTGFFLAPEGSGDAHTELLANLEALFQPATGQDNSHFLCRFPARARFLRTKLKLNEQAIPKPDCSELETFRKDFGASSISLVYATANMNEPASMFGHTMLLLDKEDETPLDDPVVSFVANVTSSGLARLFDGVLGGFKGIVEVANFAQRMATYNTQENRNLWVFKLKIEQVAVDRLVDHLWELNSTHFEYFYMDENCSFYNQFFLQIAYPELDIASMGAFSLPLEAVHLVLKHQHLLEEVSFYPAARNVYRGGLDRLSSAEQALVEQLSSAPRAVNSPNAPVIYKTALHRRWMQSYAKGKKISEADNSLALRLSELLKATGADPQLTQPDLTNPTIGHGPHAISIGGGYGPGGGGATTDGTDSPFLTFEIRPLLHTLSEPPLSYAPFSEIQFLSTSVRLDPEDAQVWLDQFVVGSVYSFSPIGYGLYPRSWSLEAGVRHLSREGRQGYATYFDWQLGYTLPLTRKGALSLLLGPTIEWTPSLDGYRLGGLAQGSLIVYAHDRWTLSARGGVRGYGLPERSLVPWGEGHLHIFLSPAFSIAGAARYVPVGHHVETRGVLRFHFF